MSSPGSADELVGRDRLLGRLHGVVDRLLDGGRATALVAGEAGIGKTSLLRAVAASADAQGVHLGWGTCVDIEAAPGYWPWTQALEGLVRTVGLDAARAAAAEDGPLLGAIVPSLAGAAGGEATARERLLAMDATVRLLERLASHRPVLLVLDDLQWADESSLALLDFIARAPTPARGGVGIGVIGAYRHDELPPGAVAALAGLAPGVDRIQVAGLDVTAVQHLLERTTGTAVDPSDAVAIHHRTGGHPFFVRELALLALHDDASSAHVPAAVREAVHRRVGLLPAPSIAVLEAAAVLGLTLLPDVVAAVLGCSVVDVERSTVAAVEAGVLHRVGAETRFSHDLLREALLERLDAARRMALHRDVGAALEGRFARGGPVTPAELARHFIAAVPVDGPDRAVRWALEAAASDCDTLAFVEAAGHLRRARTAITDAGLVLDDARLAEVLMAEADALARAGRPVDARGLLHHATDVAIRAGDPILIARAALATAQLGAQFAMRRDEVVRGLERALDTVRGHDEIWEARLSATLARELQHSVPDDRPRAGPLSERALDLGRRGQDPATLLSCLLARHDLLWTPGTAPERCEIAREIISVALASGDHDRRIEGLLLLANAQLELGSPAFEAPLEECLALLDDRGLPGDRYTALTRRACLALLRNRLDDADRLIEEAAVVGERIREPDTGNVRMSQRLELVRAGQDPGQLRSFAGQAITHWTGAPVHAHAVAAGFLARAGDLDAAARHVATVVDLGTWRTDRSYLWSVFVRELAHAAIALEARELCQQLLDDVRPLAKACGVNGAVVAFAGSLAHTAGLLADALGQPGEASPLLEQAARTYRRLGAVGWRAEIEERPAPAVREARATASLRRQGPVWHVTFAGRATTVPHTKGMADLARLVGAAGSDVHVLELIDASDRSGPSGTVTDRAALAAYRQRIEDLDAQIDEAVRDNDEGRRAMAEVERQAILDEVVRATGTGGRPRQFANHPAERARKAVAGRIRDAIRKLDPLLPELAAHFERTVVTGAYCRYRPDASVVWDLDPPSPGLPPPPSPTPP